MTPTAPTALDWLIVGGGLHGVHLAVRLLAEGGVAPGRLRLLDPATQLLDSWRRCTANTGMTHLRSPGVHHLDVDPWSLLRFAGADARGRGAPPGTFIAPYSRPSVELFARHCDRVIARHGLTDLHLRHRAERIVPVENGALVHLDNGDALPTRHVILASGAADQPRWPASARALQARGLPVQHVFEPGFTLQPDAWPRRVAVLGGGISAAQVALRLADTGREVHMVTRHALRRHPFDSDSGWAGPKNMRRFSATSSLRTRRAMIREARHVGSLPPEVARAVRSAVRQQHLHLHHGEPVPTPTDDGLRLDIGETRIHVDGLLLATGFESRRPGGALVDALVHDHGLPCAACGYPVVDSHLRWHPSVFVSGPLAELEIGPVSRNILGARRSAERIVPVARG